MNTARRKTVRSCGKYCALAIYSAITCTFTYQYVFVLYVTSGVDNLRKWLRTVHRTCTCTMTFHVFMLQNDDTAFTCTCISGSLHRDTPNTPPPSLHTSQGASSADVRGDVTVVRDRLMHIKVKLIDKKCPDLATKYNQVCYVKHCAIPGVNTTDKTVGLVQPVRTSRMSCSYVVVCGDVRCSGSSTSTSTGWRRR